MFPSCSSQGRESGYEIFTEATILDFSLLIVVVKGSFMIRFVLFESND